MKLVVDENIPYGKEAFGLLGKVATAAGRDITRDMLLDADALIVRSITKCNEALLQGTAVRFVGTCTIGEDHIDKPWLAQQDIGFSSAPGCNANSVGEYIAAALLVLSERYQRPLKGLKLGIVGVGNVGTRVLQKAQALGINCVLNDPPLAEQTGDDRYRPIEEILDCDAITFHTPIEKEGPHPTWHLADETFISRMKSGAWLLNSSRGPVVDNKALLHALTSGHLQASVMDVWEGEPEVNEGLLKTVDIASPHIAGYSFDGKVNGTRQIYEAACTHFGVAAQWDPATLLPEPDCPSIEADPEQADVVGVHGPKVYDILEDDSRMRQIIDIPAAERAAFFDRLRKEYPRRREFQNTRVQLTSPSEAIASSLEQLGFRLR